MQGLVEPGNQSIGVKGLAPNPATLGDPWFSRTAFTPSTLLPELVGYEWDLIAPGCSTPPLTDLFHVSGTPNYDGVRYTAPSGARVFSAGTLRLGWGLDDTTGHGSPALQQFTRNAMDDLTRPAPPASVRLTRVRAGVRISVRRLPDARARRLVVYAGRRLVCDTPGSACVDSRARRGRKVRYTIVLRDRWRASFPVTAR